MTEGKDAAALTLARQELETHGLPPAQMEEVCADMSPAYAKGVREEFPAARRVFDFFHVVGWLTSAVDTVRRRESAGFPDLLTQHALPVAQERGKPHARAAGRAAAVVPQPTANGPGARSLGGVSRSPQSPPSGGGRERAEVVVQLGVSFAPPGDDQGRPRASARTGTGWWRPWKPG